MKKAKIEMETLGKLLLLTAFLIIFLLMFKGCKDQMENVGTVGMNEYLCWLSKTMQADLSFLFPSACYPIDVEEPKDKLGISILMRKCWWIYGQGDKDIPAGETSIEKLKNRIVTWYDVAGTCYMFTPKEDTNLNELREYLRKYNKAGEKVKEEDSKETTWGYIQKKSTEKDGICFDEKIEDKLLKGKRYFVIFYDDRSPISKGERDRIMISRDPQFGEGQTGAWAWAKEQFTSLGCEDLKQRTESGVAKEQAKSFFDKLVRTVQDCMGRAWSEACICDDSSLDPLNELPRDYSIDFKKVEEKKYKISLLDKNGKVYTENGTEFTETVEGDRLGNWEIRERDRTDISRCLPGVFDEYKITKYLKDYYIMYHPNNEPTRCFIERKEHNPRQEDFAAVYLVQKELTGFKKCSEIK